MKRILPALPTLIVCAFLAIDLAEIFNQLYLAIFAYYFGFLAIVLVALITSSVITKSFRSPSSISCLLLLIGIVVFPLLGKPVEGIIENQTKWNRSFAVIRTQYKGTNSVEFTITAQGEGSLQNLTLDSGYANISINEDYLHGPSLNYELSPELTIRDDRIRLYEYVPMNKSTLMDIYRNKGLADIATDENIEEFLSILKTMSHVSSEKQFNDVFIEIKNSEISLIAFENATYRVNLLLISLIALSVSIIMTKQNAQPDPGPYLDNARFEGEV